MGGTSTTTTKDVPPALQALYGMQTDFAASQLPAVEQLTSTVTSGSDVGTTPYVSGLYALLQRGADQAAKQIRQQTPRGAAQDYAVSQAYRDAGMQRGQVASQQMQWVMQQLYNLITGFNPQNQIGQTTSKPSEFGLSLGPFSYSTGL
jgi:hypothetical protein